MIAVRGPDQQAVLVRQHDLARSERRQRVGRGAEVRVPRQEFRLHGVRLQDVDQREHRRLFGPRLVAEAAPVRHDAHIALHVEREPLGARAQLLQHGERHLAAHGSADQERPRLQPGHVLEPDRVGHRGHGQDALVDVRRRVFKPHQRRCRRGVREHGDALALQRLGHGGVLVRQSRDGADTDARQARRLRGVAVAAAVDVARARARHDGVLGVVADRDQVVAFVSSSHGAPQSLSRTRQSVATSSIETTDEPIQRRLTGPKS